MVTVNMPFVFFASGYTVKGLVTAEEGHARPVITSRYNFTQVS